MIKTATQNVAEIILFATSWELNSFYLDNNTDAFNIWPLLRFEYSLFRTCSLKAKLCEKVSSLKPLTIIINNILFFIEISLLLYKNVSLFIY